MNALYIYFTVRERSSLIISILPQALRVSDHYPVEVEICDMPPFWIGKSYQQRCENIETMGASVNTTGEEQTLIYPLLTGAKCLRQELTCT